MPDPTHPTPPPAEPPDPNKTLIDELQKKNAELAAQNAQLSASANKLKELEPRAAKYQSVVQEMVDAGKAKLPEAVQAAMEPLPLEAKFRMVRALTAGAQPPQADPPPAEPPPGKPPAANPPPTDPPPAPPPSAPPPPPAAPPPPKQETLDSGYDREVAQLKAAGRLNSATLHQLAEKYRGKQ